MQKALSTAPFIPDLGQSLLHLWTGLESLFPRVGSEVRFQIALYLTQLRPAVSDRYAYHKSIVEAYNLRSRVAHGTAADLGVEEWRTVWNLLVDACQSIISRGHLPTEEELLRELLAPVPTSQQ